MKLLGKFRSKKWKALLYYVGIGRMGSIFYPKSMPRYRIDIITTTGEGLHRFEIPFDSRDDVEALKRFPKILKQFKRDFNPETLVEAPTKSGCEAID